MPHDSIRAETAIVTGTKPLRFDCVPLSHEQILVLLFETTLLLEYYEPIRLYLALGIAQS